MWFFPSARLWEDKERDGSPRTGERAHGKGRHHIHDIMINREIARVVKLIALGKRVTAHTLRHSFATHLVLKGVELMTFAPHAQVTLRAACRLSVSRLSRRRSARSVQQILGHLDVRTTEIYTELARAMRGEITSPLDDL
jgi:integrase